MFKSKQNRLFWGSALQFNIKVIGFLIPAAFLKNVIGRMRLQPLKWFFHYSKLGPAGLQGIVLLYRLLHTCMCSYGCLSLLLMAERYLAPASHTFFLHLVISTFHIVSFPHFHLNLTPSLALCSCVVRLKGGYRALQVTAFLFVPLAPLNLG